MSNPNYLRSRGTDHATNGIRMGIDGWIYIAVGDFGFHNAIGADGTKLTMLGGGIVRVRPDGSEMEVYIHGTRNIYDVAIDPYMNVFTRGNTNDGGGWNIRFNHDIQSGEYGYPMLFKHFTEEIIPALIDAGGGSGTGALFMDEPTWPDKYNHVPMMADWGRSELYIHRLTPVNGQLYPATGRIHSATANYRCGCRWIWTPLSFGMGWRWVFRGLHQRICGACGTKRLEIQCFSRPERCLNRKTSDFIKIAQCRG